VKVAFAKRVPVTYLSNIHKLFPLVKRLQNFLSFIIPPVKTQIITLESHDDLISVRDRLSWAKTPRILLVWPKYENVTLRQVDLKVLQRHAASLGAQLGLVTRTRLVRAEAEALGIPVFESAGQAQRVAWPKIRRKKLPHRPTSASAKSLREKQEQVHVKEEAWRAHPVTRILALAIGVMSVLALVALFIPRAQVILKPVMQTQSIVISVNANPAVKSVFITGSVPIYEKRIIVDGSQTVLVTGEGIVPQSKAKGIAEFHNLTQQAVTIPLGTVVQTSDTIRFVTTEDGEVAAGVGKKIEVPIEAQEGGNAGNLEAETINAIEGRLGLSLSVTNPEPTTGGRELSSVQASDADRKRVKDLLMKDLEKRARENLGKELKSGDLLFDKTLTVTQTFSEKYDPPAGAAGTKLTLTMQVEFSVQYVSASDLTELATLAMNAALPSGFHAAPGAVTVKPVTNPFFAADKSLHWTMRAERQIAQSFDEAQITQWVLGNGVKKAQSNLDKNLPSTSTPKIQLSPSWWPWVPLVPFRIEVVTGQG
jgi:hypothetical protein